MQMRAWALAALLLIVCPIGSKAAIIHESATLGTTGTTSGTELKNTQFLGSRFSVTTPVSVDNIGGHIVGTLGGNSSLFGAIVSLSSPSATPTGSPFNTSEFIAQTTFTAPVPSEDLLVPLSATLNPGNYAVIFGSGLFGATGKGFMPGGGDSDIPGQASYFFWDGAAWQNGGFNNRRFVVTGDPVPSPSAMLLFGTGLFGLVGWRWWSTKTT